MNASSLIEEELLVAVDSFLGACFLCFSLKNLGKVRARQLIADCVSYGKIATGNGAKAISDDEGGAAGRSRINS